MTDEMNDLLQAVAAEWGQGSQEHNIARDVCKLANKEIEALTDENEVLTAELKWLYARIEKYKRALGLEIRGKQQ